MCYFLAFSLPLSSPPVLRMSLLIPPRCSCCEIKRTRLRRKEERGSRKELKSLSHRIAASVMKLVMLNVGVLEEEDRLHINGLHFVRGRWGSRKMFEELSYRLAASVVRSSHSTNNFG